jgi:hypothetical protein
MYQAFPVRITCPRRPTTQWDDWWHIARASGMPNIQMRMRRRRGFKEVFSQVGLTLKDARPRQPILVPSQLLAVESNGVAYRAKGLMFFTA